MNNLFRSVMGFNHTEIGMAKECGYIATKGQNYPDYYHNQTCKLYSTEDNDIYAMSIGNVAYSCKTGKRLEQGDLII